MSKDLPAELAALPAPELIEEIGYESLRGVLVDKIKAQFDAYGVDWDVDSLETDPGVIVAEAETYVEMLLRQRINEAMRANLLAFAYGGDLDHLGQFYDVTRLSGESDDAFTRRIVLAIRGRSTGGTAPRYRSVALGADVRVADAAVYTEGRDPTVKVAIFSTDNNGVPDAGLLSAVDAALQDAAVRMVNDTIAVSAAVQEVVDVTADVWLLPQTSNTLIDTLKTSVESAWAAESGLGFDMTRSWLTARLMQVGVQRVEITSPAADVIVPFNRAVALGTVTLTNRGRDY